MGAVITKPNARVLPAAGLPAWAVVALDGAIGSGVIPWDGLDRLRSRELLAVASAIVRAQLDGVDVSRVVGEVKQRKLG